CQKGVTPPARDGRHLMKRAARKHQGAAMRRPIGLPAELRKHQVATVIVAVEVNRDGKATMLRGGVDIVAMAIEVPTNLAVVASDDVSIHPCRLELKISFYRRK